MIEQRAFSVEAWGLTETELRLDLIAQAESLFALSNGHIGLRGNLDEGEPHGLPGTYLNSVHELRPLPYAEAGYGFPESGQTVINVTNGKIMRLLVDDEPFDVRYGQLRKHVRHLDFREGVLTRVAEWTSPARRTVRVTSKRLVSFTHRSIVAIVYEVEPLDGPATLVVQSELMANEALPPMGRDPREAAVLEAPLRSLEYESRDSMVELVHETKNSGIRMAAAMDHVITGTDAVRIAKNVAPDIGRVVVTDHLQPGQRLRIVKFLAYGWSRQRSLPAVRDQVGAALTSAHHAGVDALFAEQKAYLDDFWARADVDLEGDTEIQQAVRFALFHVLQAGARAELRPIPAKGLTGPGYDGHAFWDTETFVLPVLTYTNPQSVADVLRWRHGTLPIAKDRARQLGLAGAAFPWRTITGEECSAYWPAGTAAFHVNADIADAAIRYVEVTDDRAFEEETGLELLIETARLWRSLGHYDVHGDFRIDGVTGPDEYSALADNNLYTNLMAQRNLLGAADACERHLEKARCCGVTADEMAEWRAAARAVLVPYDEDLGVHQQADGFTRHQLWDFDHTKPEQYPLLLSFPYFDIYRKQVVKQSDLVLAMHLCGHAFSAEQKAKNFEYYERITVRDSSLSACTQAVLAAEVGHMALAFDYLAECALLDLQDLQHNTRNGLHIAALAGTWIALVAGLGGMRDENGVIAFAPRLPEGLTRLTFTLTRRGLQLRVTVLSNEASYELLHGEGSMEILHHGERLTVEDGVAVRRAIPTAVPRPTPTQPKGREPRHR
ncbi:hypothetical protein LVJ94_07875 [Pendulispora rubella]|uniref:Family 65 glycosyl hydrolase n=1 Tax=Pendulispora rubella TaxID=2741070 RepID=A0ABZ2LEH9_9BACT